MSVLRNRIIGHAGVGRGPGPHPAGTTATPMVMPMAHVTYGADEVALYGTLHPLVTADGAVIPAVSRAQAKAPYPAPVVPAGQP